MQIFNKQYQGCLYQLSQLDFFYFNTYYSIGRISIIVGIQRMKNQLTLGNISCIKNRIATHSCLNQNCQKYAFVCQSEECQCRQQHEDCLMVELKTIVKSIKGKVISTKELENCIETGIEKLIDQLSDFRDQMLIEIKTKFQFWGVSESEKLILSHLKEGKTETITGSQMWLAHLNFKKQESILKQQQKSITNIKTALQNFQSEIEKHSKNVQIVVNQLEEFSITQLKQNQKIFKKRKEIQKNKNSYGLPILLKIDEFNSSKLIQENQERICMSSFFYPKIIQSVKLLYRASQYAFDIGKFHQKCDNVANTLTLCETEFGKKIGGYTPIPWKLGSDSHVRDESGESFVFSLSNKDKFILQDKNNAVQHRNNNDYAPYFGNGSDFCISQKSNQNSSSYSRINSSYINNKYKQGDKESFQRFNGNPQGSTGFKVKEWEVWQIQFQK